ncbi:MAG: hypothetical protein NC221_00255 [Duncaniella sp.]|nr:hypothetical protein [Muribaculum sp.]MCM1254540.1 hypothetical protein [Duncaniella sp.]
MCRKLKALFISAMSYCMVYASAPSNEQQLPRDSTVTAMKSMEKVVSNLSRLHIGGYGEVAMSRNFYSDNYLRYTQPEKYRNQSHGRFDLPHVVIYLGYDFGKGWSMSSEIEFEHGGNESAIDIETEEAGEYESEIERGGEVALEQFYIQKEFMPQLKLRAGMQVVPVGATNAHHEPNQFFGVYRPEGENTIMPCTWHEVSVSLSGDIGKWSYIAMFLPGLDSERFGNQSWIHDGSASPFEFKIANNYAFAARVDNYSVKGLRLGVSGYVGNSFRNTLYPTSSSKNDGIHGTVTIASFDFKYDDHNLLARGYFDWGHLSDAAHISKFNIAMSKNSTSKRQEIASDAIAAGIEAGYNIFGLIPKMMAKNQKFFVFGRYDYYDSMAKMESGTPLGWCGRHKITAGVNWYPIPQVVIKGDYSYGILERKYNNEPSINIGIAYTGWFM